MSLYGVYRKKGAYTMKRNDEDGLKDKTTNKMKDTKEQINAKPR